MSKLSQLRDKLQNAEKFHEIFEFFLDHFGENDEFHDICERTSDPVLESIIAEVGKTILGHPVTLNNVIFARPPGYRFIHGGFQMDGLMTNVLYFEDIRTGLLGVMQPGETKLIRFRGEAMPGDDDADEENRPDDPFGRM